MLICVIYGIAILKRSQKGAQKEPKKSPRRAQKTQKILKQLKKQLKISPKTVRFLLGLHLYLNLPWTI